MHAFHNTRIFHWCLVLGLLAAGCSDRSGSEATSEIAVTNSYLGSAVRDLCGSDMAVMSLAPPGMCPGHFDMSPAQVSRLQGCRLLLLFDFQSQVEATLSRLKDKGLKTHLIKGRKGLCLPESYLATCREVAPVLAQVYPERADGINARLGEIEQRLAGLGGALKQTVADSDAASAVALASHHQADFANWLGLQTVATFVGGDTETVGHIDHCLKQAAGHEVRFVVANQQEGTALAQALAERLDAKAVIFSNFPPEGVEGPAFDCLLRNNVQQLLQAAAQ